MQLGRVARGTTRPPSGRPAPRSPDPRRSRRPARARPAGPTTDASSGMSCSMTRIAQPSSSRSRRISGPSASASRWAMPDDGSSSSSTVGRVGDDAREVDDPPRARRQLADETGRGRRRGRTARSARRPGSADAVLGVDRRRQAEDRVDRILDLDPPVERHRDASPRRSGGNSAASWNDRPSPSAARRCGAQPATSTPPRTTRPRSRGVNPQIRSNSVVLPAPFGPMMPDDLPLAARSDRHVVDGPDAAEADSDSPWVVEHDRSRVTSSRATAPAGRRATCCERRLRSRPRNTERRRSGRSSSSAVGPGEPDLALLHEVARARRASSATFTDCSTRMIVVPPRRHLADDVGELLDDHRREAERQLVDHQQPRAR